MKALLCILLMLNGSLGSTYNAFDAGFLDYQDQLTSDGRRIIEDCTSVFSEDGFFSISSGNRNRSLCSFNLYSPPNTSIQLDILPINGACGHYSTLVMFDGWFAEGRVFPSEQDSSVPMSERFQDKCSAGTRFPVRATSSQNAVSLLYQLNTPGSAVVVRVRHAPKKEPCHQVVTSQQRYVLANHGRRCNCSLLALGPVKFHVTSLQVGEVSTGHLPPTNLLGRLIRLARDANSVLGTKRAAKSFKPGAGPDLLDVLELGETDTMDPADGDVRVHYGQGDPTTDVGGVTCIRMFFARLASSGLVNNRVVVNVHVLTTDEYVQMCMTS